MAFLPLAEGARFQLVFGDGTYNWTNTMFATKTDWGSADAISLSDAIRAGLNGLANKPWASVYSYREFVVYDQRAEDAPVYRYTVTPVVGSQAGEVTDKSSSLVVTFRTALRGRSGRGRWYLGGLTEGNMNSGLWVAGIVTQAQLMVTAVMNAIITQGWTPVIKSTRHNNQPRTEAVAIAITGWLIRNNVPGSQDRRNRRP